MTELEHATVLFITMVLQGSSGNNAFRLKEIRHYSGNDVNHPDYRYKYDSAGNITQIYTARQSFSTTENFAYDHLNRLTGVTGTYNQNYAYDTLGNLTQLGSDTLAYLDPNHPHAVSKLNNNSNAFAYDRHGNMTYRKDLTGEYNQTFDVENRLTAVEKVGVGTTNFEYDPNGIRTLTIQPNGTKIYTPFPGYEQELIPAPSPLCGHVKCAPTIIKRATYALGGYAIATKISGDPTAGNNGTFFIYSDHLGSMRYLTIGNNVVATSRADFMPFGDWRTEPTSGLTDEGYTGHTHNNLGGGANDLGLVYMNARYYVPGVGRFASADTIVPNPASGQSFNRYSYVLNNPLGFSDPSGHCQTDPMDEYHDYECWMLAEQLHNSMKEYFDVSYEVLGTFTLSELRELDQLVNVYFAARSKAEEIASQMPQQMEHLDSIDPDEFLRKQHNEMKPIMELFGKIAGGTSEKVLGGFIDIIGNSNEYSGFIQSSGDLVESAAGGVGMGIEVLGNIFVFTVQSTTKAGYTVYILVPAKAAQEALETAENDVENKISEYSQKGVNEP